MYKFSDIPDILRMRIRAVRKRTRAMRHLRRCEKILSQNTKPWSKKRSRARMIIFSVDPGTERSAWCLFNAETKTLERSGLCPNDELLAAIGEIRAQVMVIEMFKSYGNVMGDSVLQTCVWIGRFIQQWVNKNILGEYALMPRKAVVTHLCMNPRANDSNVRQALIDRFSAGKGKDVAVGSKARPGPLYGVKNDIWSALAIAISWNDLNQEFQNKLT